MIEKLVKYIILDCHPDLIKNIEASYFIDINRL